MLTPREIETIKETTCNYIPPKLKGWAHAIHLGLQQQDMKEFSPDRAYTATELKNLHSALQEAGLNEEKLNKICAHA